MSDLALTGLVLAMQISGERLAVSDRVVFWWVGYGVWACGVALGVARIVWGRRCVGDRSVGGALVGWVLGFCG